MLHKTFIRLSKILLIEQRFTALANERRDGQRMKPRLKALFTALAVALLSAALLAPIAGANGRGRHAFVMPTTMPTPRRRPTMMPTPTPSPSSTASPAGRLLVRRRHVGRLRLLGRHRHVGHRHGCSVADEQPRRPAGLAAAPRRPRQGAADLVRDLQGRPHLPRGTAGAARSLDQLLERHEGLLPAVRRTAPPGPAPPSTCGAAGRWAA